MIDLESQMSEIIDDEPKFNRVFSEQFASVSQLISLGIIESRSQVWDGLNIAEVNSLIWSNPILHALFVRFHTRDNQNRDILIRCLTCRDLAHMVLSIHKNERVAVFEGRRQ